LGTKGHSAVFLSTAIQMNLANHLTFASLPHLDPVCLQLSPPPNRPFSMHQSNTPLLPSRSRTSRLAPMQGLTSCKKPSSYGNLQLSSNRGQCREPASKANSKEIGEREETNTARGIHRLEFVVSGRQGSVLRAPHRRPGVAHGFPCSRARSAPAAFRARPGTRKLRERPRGSRANAMLTRARLCCPRRHACSLAALTRVAVLVGVAVLARVAHWPHSPAPPCSLAGRGRSRRRRARSLAALARAAAHRIRRKPVVSPQRNLSCFFLR
jgi:hypothetical protein